MTCSPRRAVRSLALAVLGGIFVLKQREFREMLVVRDGVEERQAAAAERIVPVIEGSNSDDDVPVDEGEETLPADYATSAAGSAPETPPTDIAPATVSLSPTAAPPPAPAPKAPACPGPMRAPAMAAEKAKALQKQILKTTEAWGYFSEHGHQWRPLKSKRILDVGMGQGPLGVVAISMGVAKYVGLDPAICLNVRAMTRHKKVKKVEGKAGSAYQLFPHTGLEMMTAFGEKITLLPGTFETLQGTGFLQRGAFDVATLWSVTEHLPDNYLVIKGISDYLEAGQVLRIHHHNYYSWDGHHRPPRTPDSFDKSSAAQQQVAQWRHLQPNSEVAQDRNLNRIRLGDLIALAEIYFQCSWKAWVTPGARSVLLKDKALLTSLQKRGFDVAELLVTRWSAACTRREEVGRLPAWASSLVVHHPPLDGSYQPQPLPSKLLTEIGQEGERLAQYTAPGGGKLQKWLFAPAQ